MNVPTMTMPADVAAEKAEEYQAAFEKHGRPEDEALARGFDAMADGEELLSLSRVFDQCEADAKRRPRLAIARADRREVHWTGGAFQADRWARGPRPKDSLIPIRWRPGSSNGVAQLPLIPPTIAEGRNLVKRFVLWEVEQWADYVSDVRPDRDPFLLRRVNAGLDLFAIEAKWDLSELERWAAAQAFRATA